MAEPTATEKELDPALGEQEESAVRHGQPREYGEFEVDADVGNVPGLLIWVFAFILLWGIFAWVPFFGGVKGSYW